MLRCPCRLLLHSLISCSTRRQQPVNRYPHSKKKFISKDSSQNFQIVIDTEQLFRDACSSLQTVYQSSQSKFHRFVFSGKDAFKDLKTLVIVDHNRRILISCRRSSLNFVGHLLIWGCVIFIAVRILHESRLAIWNHFRFGSGWLVRRDRSLGGREVVVAKKKRGFRVLSNPLSLQQDTMQRNAKNVSNQLREKETLPSWWPDQLRDPFFTIDRQEHQTEARRLVQAIVENRMSGKDIMGDDIIQLRRICRVSGAKASFDTLNTKISLYRVAVHFVLDTCTRATNQSTCVRIDGEDAIQFVAGLAYNVGIDNVDAARIISAAIAARTRSCFLQAWALKLQGKDPEAVGELSKICLLHNMFPPVDSSAEMEMVGVGLKKHLKLEQRLFLMDMLPKNCGNSHTSAAQALGLTYSSVVSFVGHRETEMNENKKRRPTVVIEPVLPRGQFSDK